MVGRGGNAKKLTKPKVVQIRALYEAGGVTMEVLGRRFGVTHQSIDLLIRGLTWKHADPPSAWPSPHQDKWSEMLGRLVTYRYQHGNCWVPGRYPADPQLGNWVNTQRAFRKSGRLSEERIRRLTDIGFEWNGRRPAPQDQSRVKNLPNALRTSCKLGHPLDGVQKRHDGGRQRYCKTCRRMRAR